MDAVEHAEMVEKEFDAFIQRRSQKGDACDPDESEELWKESVGHYNLKRRAEMRAAWISYHAGQAARHRRTMEALIEDHEAQAARLCED